MAGNPTKVNSYQGCIRFMNQKLAKQIVEECIRHGIQEFCVAPGSRNAPLVYALTRSDQVKIYYWSEERSAAFFALGRIKATGKPVAVVTTSGTAAAELLPAAMSGYYLGLPLLLITADRPRRFRGTGAPQTAEQQGLFGCYVHFETDIARDESLQLNAWVCRSPAHINVCFEEPNEKECEKIEIQKNIVIRQDTKNEFCFEDNMDLFNNFIRSVQAPLVVIGSLSICCKEQAIEFLLKLNAPVYAEGTSGLREDARLDHLKIRNIEKMWRRAGENGYSIDGVLRIGEVPTARLWRDLEDLEGKVKVCSVSELPFSGLSWNGLVFMRLKDFFEQALHLSYEKKYPFQNWLKADQTFYNKLIELFNEEPHAEPSLFHTLSSRLSHQSNVYLGNSLPIREWDLAATYENKHFETHASRGVNGIDGQISTFLGVSHPDKDNWAILGDLTALYDMAGPWILSKMSDFSINIVIVNNGGGQIFSRMYALPEFTNPHTLEFKCFAEFWNMHYEKWECIPDQITTEKGHRLIEILPDIQSTQRFWQKVSTL